MTRIGFTLLAGLVLLTASAAASAAKAGSPTAPVLFATVFVEQMNPEMQVAFLRGIQEELAAHGYRPGPADGLQGPQTQGAIRKYQRDAGLTVDGRASQELLDHLKFALPKVTAKPEPEPDPLVLDLQGRLSDLGYYRGALDGRIGPETREAVRAFRYDAGLPVSGAVDADLILALEGAGAGPMPTDLPEAAEPGGDVLVPQPEDEPHWSAPLPESADPLIAVPPPPAE